jgi:26S proteasome regulatory subunit N5
MSLYVVGNTGNHLCCCSCAQAAIADSLAVAQEKGIDDAVIFLLPLEKKCRVNNDFVNLKEVSLQLVRLCRAMNDWDKLNAVLALINKRSATQKSTLSAVVAEGIQYLESTPSLEVKVALIVALKDVCEGKLFVEGESARLNFMLAAIYEAKGDIAEACNTVQDVHVETYGSLTKQEKATYILEQIRLNLLRKDFIRTAIHSRKMNTKTIDEEGFEDIKVKFYTLQIEFHTHDMNAWEMCQAYHKVSPSLCLSVCLSVCRICLLY